jgi:hypothetical protein
LDFWAGEVCEYAGGVDGRQAARCLDDEAADVVSDSATVSSFSVRNVLFLSVLFALPLYVTDAEQAYLQSHNISRIIFARLPKELRSPLQGRFFRILQPVYGIQESRYCSVVPEKEHQL